MHSSGVEQTLASSRAITLEPLEELLLLRELERFVAMELELLDSRQFEAWSELFTPEGIYWAPSSIDQANPIDEVSLLFDDQEIRRVRFARLRHPRVHAQLPHSRTTHLVGNFVIGQVDETRNQIEFRCRFVMHDYRPGFEQRAFSGSYEYAVVRQDGSFSIKRKKAIIINCDAMHFPISIPL
jgi:3-phenylpropionate/cinnamic acid dioxygenase small subunit